MKKQILMTVSPVEALNILNGKQSLLLRKRVPKGYVGWVWLGVSKGKPFLMHAFDNTYYLHDMTEKYRMKNDLNGSIVARYWHEEVEEIDYENIDVNEYDCDVLYETKTLLQHQLLYKSCVNYDYVNDIILGNGKDLYAIHLNRFEILDKPMALGEFYKNTYLGDETIKHQYRDNKPEEDTLHEIYLKSPTSLPSTYQYVYVNDR